MYGNRVIIGTCPAAAATGMAASSSGVPSAGSRCYGLPFPWQMRFSPGFALT
jgi:hypothetical protein